MRRKTKWHAAACIQETEQVMEGYQEARLLNSQMLVLNYSMLNLINVYQSINPGMRLCGWVILQLEDLSLTFQNVHVLVLHMTCD